MPKFFVSIIYTNEYFVGILSKSEGVTLGILGDLTWNDLYILKLGVQGGWGGGGGGKKGSGEN